MVSSNKHLSPRTPGSGPRLQVDPPDWSICHVFGRFGLVWSRFGPLYIKVEASGVRASMTDRLRYFITPNLEKYKAVQFFSRVGR